MRDAAVDRLSKLINDYPGRRKKQRENDPDLDGPLGMAEGFFSLFLLVVVVFCTVWTTQAANWVDNLQVLTLDALIGIIAGVWAAKQRYFRPSFVYIALALFALLWSLWQTIAVSDDSSPIRFVQSVQQGIVIISSGGSSQDQSLYLVPIILCCLLLAFFSAFSLYKWRNPWLPVLLNIFVLLFNLNVVSETYVVLLVLFLATGLLLIVRFHLYETLKRWDLLNLRYSENLGWNVMQMGLIVIVGLLLAACILPGTYENPVLNTFLLAKNGPLSLLGRAAGADSGTAAPNHGNFNDSWSLGGNPNLTKDVVMRVTFTGSDPQYLSLVTYDTYDNGWSITHSANDQTYPIKVNDVLTPQATMTHNVKQTVQVVSSLDEQKAYIGGASEVISTTLPAYIVEGSGGTVGWLGENVNMNAGLHYTVTSAVSSASENDLRGIPMPDKAPKRLYNRGAGDYEVPVEYFEPQIVTDFTRVPPALQKDGHIHALAQKIVSDAHAQTMYDKVVALESYLRAHYQYNTDIHPKIGMDPVLWFLFANANNDGYCNYFSTAMTLMARSLGIPAREVVGYTNGTLEQNAYVVRGVDAHSWTQVYFAGYGWINFEPSASFKTFTRPAPHEFPSSTPSGSTSNLIPLPVHHPQTHIDGSNAGTTIRGGNSGATLSDLRGVLTAAIVALLVVLLLGTIIFWFWWRRLYQRYSLAAQLYGRICLLAEWAGLRHQQSQTPYEYLDLVSSTVFSDQSQVGALKRLGDIYVQERWRGPVRAESDRLNEGGMDLRDLWRMLRPRLFIFVLRHPAFLLDIAPAIWRMIIQPMKKYRARSTKRAKIHSVRVKEI